MSHDDIPTVECATCHYAHLVTDPGCLNPMCTDRHGITPERRAELVMIAEQYRAEQSAREARQRLYAQSFRPRA